LALALQWMIEQFFPALIPAAVPRFDSEAEL
jgi:hypothetical protein